MTTKLNQCAGPLYGNDCDACPCDDPQCGACRDRERLAFAERRAREALQPVFDALTLRLLSGQATLEQIATQAGTPVPWRRP